MNRKERRAATKPGQRQVQTAPQAVAALFAEAIAHAQAGRSKNVVACFRKAIKILPDFAPAYYNLGKALAEQSRLNEAVDCFRKTVELAPGLAEAHANLGAALRQQGQLGEAAACCRKAIEINPQFPLAQFNLGTVLEAQRQLNDAAECYRQAVRLRPDFAEAHYNLGLMLLSLGDMPAGWEEYEWRWKTPQMLSDARNFRQPQWRGQQAEGRTLLIHAEQGFGDSLQFCRYAPLAAARGLRVVLEVPKPLVRLLRSVQAVDLIVGRGEDLPVFDFHIPMLSLPLALGTTLATIPRAIPYLRADPAEVDSWRSRLAASASQGPRVGLVWAGNARKDIPALVAVDRQRSIGLERLAALFECAPAHFFSLQKDQPAGRGPFPLIDLMGEIEDFAGTAALIANLDLVISVDTAVAHLAAALGKPVWLLNRFNSDWRWMDGQRHSPWYPTLRVYRQHRADDWDAVVAEISRDLQSFVASRAAG